MDWNSNGTTSYKQPINSNTLPHKYNGMVKVLPTSVVQSQRHVSVNGYNGSETRNFTQNNFPVGFTPTMMVTSQTSDVPRIRPPPPSPRANVQQRKGRTEKSRAAHHKSMFDLRDVGQDIFQRPQQPQSMAPATLITSSPRPGYPCYDRNSLNLSYQDLRLVGSAPQVQQQSTHSQFQNTQYIQQNRFSFNTGVINNRAIPTAISSITPENQYFKPQLPPTTSTMQVQYTQPSTPPIKTKNDDMKSLHDEMAQLRLELASMKDFMMEEEEFQSKQVQELKQLQKQFHESSKLIQEQKPKERESSSQTTSKFNSLPIITASQNAKLLPPQSPKPTLMVKPTPPSKASQFSSMKNPIEELEQRFNMQTEQEKSLKKQSEQAVEPNKFPPSKLSSLAPVFPKTTYSTPPKSPKPVTSQKPSVSPSNQLRRSYSVTPTNPSPQNKSTKPSEIVFPKTGHLVPPTKLELPGQINGDKNNNYPIVPSKIYSGSGETKSKPLESSNVKVKRISQMFEGNLNEINEKGSQQKINSYYDPKIGGGTARKLSPAVLQSIQALEESKLSGTQATSQHIPKSTNLKSNFEVSKLETTNIPRDFSESPRVPPILKSSPALSQLSPETKPSVILPSSSSLKSPLPSIEPPLSSRVKLSQPKSTLPASQTLVLPPSPPPASLKPSATIIEPPSPQYKEMIDSPYSSQIPVPDDNVSEQILTTFTFTPESTLTRYANIPESEPDYEYQENAQVNSDNSFLPPSPSQIDTHKHRYENVSDSEQDTSVPDYSPPLPPKDFLPDQSTSEDIYEAPASHNQQDISAEPATPKPTEIQHPHSKTSFLAANDNVTGTTSPSSISHQRKSSIPVIIRPSTAPPPPPPTSVPTEKTEQHKVAPQTLPTLPIVSPSSPPPPPPIPTENFTPSPPPPPPPEYILENTPPPSSLSFHHRRASSSGISSTTSIPGSPLSPVETKSHLLEQIRQFKQSGKGLKKANENEEQVGTPTRVRRNSIQDALLTRFKAFSGNQSESSEDEQNNVEDDWED